MKTLTKDNVSIYLFADYEELVISEENIIVGNPPKFIIGDCNSTDTVLHEGVTEPDGWLGHKYLYDGTAWAENPAWVDPETLGYLSNG